MTPKGTNNLQTDFTIEELPTRTHRLNLEAESVTGFTDRIEAMKQAIYLTLSIERYQYIIYSWNYGVELNDLFGQPISFVIPEIKRRITEALLQDSRITSVEDFHFESRRNTIHTTFTVKTIFGEIPVEKAVKI